jgi:hypothetical protein
MMSAAEVAAAQKVLPHVNLKDYLEAAAPVAASAVR